MNRTFLLVGIAAMAAAACDSKEESAGAGAPTATAQQKKTLSESDLEIFEPLPEVVESEDNPITEPKVELGRMLYYDPRLSKNHDVSCNSCHHLKEYGVDSLRVSKGHKEQEGTRNSPSVYNAALYSSQFWDGRAEDVEEQAQMPITNPVEMAMPVDGALVTKTLSSIPAYVKAFEKAFPDQDEPVTMANLGKAIGAFERKLVTPSPFDEFLKGDKDALTAAQKEGLATFIEQGCTTCHNGAGIGGNSFQKLGLVKPWPNQDDQGRFEETKKAADKMMFRTPGLRNVAKTAPYFHDGSVATLEEAIEKMAWHQLGRKLEPSQVKAIKAFLESLTGKLPPDSLIAEPELPASTDETPKPSAD